MKLNNYFLIFIFVFFLTSCSKDVSQKSVIKEKSLDLQVLEAYEGGKKALDEGDVLFAAKKFNEAEILFPQSDWAPKSALMAAYSYYSQDYYNDAVSELARFIKIYPNYKNIDYAYYLLGLCFYEQIVDEKKDLKSIVDAKKYLEIVVRKYPNTDYALDAEFKLSLIDDVLASKEMYIGRYYFNKKKLIVAINRFRTVVDQFETTTYTEEALHRLVEVYYTLGLVNEADKYAKLLGYNYQSSRWYEQTYVLFNKNYEINKDKIRKDKKKNKSILKKFKSLFD